MKQQIKALQDRVSQELQHRISPKQKLYCALSGGADSVFLLRMLQDLEAEFGYQLEAVHVNHNLRGAESDRDEAFCRTLCQKRNIPLTCFSVDVHSYQEQHKCSVEVAARACRYNAFAQLDSQARIATAHTASDNLETFLYRVLRGSTLHGLTAIPVEAGVFIRPILSVTREEVEAYLSEIGQDYVTDSSNLTDDYTRNKIRHQVVPLLKTFNSGIEKSSVNMLQSLRTEDAFIESESQKLYASVQKNQMQDFSHEPEAVRLRCIRAFLQEHNLPCDTARILEIGQMPFLEKETVQVNLTREQNLVWQNGAYKLEPLVKKQEYASVPFITGRETTLFPDRFVIGSVKTGENFVKFANIHKKFTDNVLDYDTIKGNLTLSNRQYGTTIQLAGKSFHTTLKKLIQAKLPPEERRELYMLSDEVGVIWVERIGIAARVQPNENTKHWLVLEVK